MRQIPFFKRKWAHWRAAGAKIFFRACGATIFYTSLISHSKIGTTETMDVTYISMISWRLNIYNLIWALMLAHWRKICWNQQQASLFFLTKGRNTVTVAPQAKIFRKRHIFSRISRDFRYDALAHWRFISMKKLIAPLSLWRSGAVHPKNFQNGTVYPPPLSTFLRFSKIAIKKFFRHAPPKFFFYFRIKFFDEFKNKIKIGGTPLAYFWYAYWADFGFTRVYP